MSMKLEERFLSKVDKTEECWLWTAALSHNGYGRMRVGKKIVRATHISMALYHPDLAPGEVVMHSCDNPICVNPSHLSWGTQMENIADRDSKNRQAKGEKNGASKITADIAQNIRVRYAEKKVTQKELAALYGISQRSVSYIVNGKTWSSV